MNNTAILGLRAETSLHPGSGQMAGGIDLPIQREAHTDWPVIFGSSVKGAMRTYAEDMGCDWVKDVFGPDTSKASENAGALLISDARILLLPVRSLSTHFRWVTCPAVLRRFSADMERLGMNTFSKDSIVEPLDSEAVIARSPTSGKKTEQANLLLEEFRLSTKEEDLNDLIGVLDRYMGEAIPSSLEKQLAIVSDDIFRYLARFSTPVTPHICINSETKTVKDGALWYEETLPPDTLLYVCLDARKSRVPGSKKQACDILKHISDLFELRSYLQIGGNETLGMGWCKVSVVRETQASEIHVCETQRARVV